MSFAQKACSSQAATWCFICVLLAGGTISTFARNEVQPYSVASTAPSWRLGSAIQGSDVARRQLAHAHRRTHGPSQQQPSPAADFMKEMGVMYRYNDMLQGIVRNGTAEECAAACGATKSPRCAAWSWLPARSTAHPSTCSLKSARGTMIEASPGAVSGYLTGTAPYSLELRQRYHGHTIANATVQSMEDCATACTTFQGSKSHSRCSAWTWQPGDDNRPSSCKLKSARGSAEQAHAGAVSGYLAGTSPFILHQGMSFGDMDLPTGSSVQPSIEACAEGCRKYTGASPCVAWTFSSPENGTPGTCQLKAAVGAVRLTDQNVVSGHMSAQDVPASHMKNYTVEYDRGYRFNDLHLGMTKQTTAEACAAACTARVNNTACVAWTWAPPTHPSTPRLCRLLSARGSDVQQEPGLVSGYISGTAPYQLEVGKEYVENELAVLKQPDIAARSAAHCASACTLHQGRVRCSAWTFNHMPSSSAGNCTLRSSRGSEAVNSSSAVSGYIQGTHPYILQQGVADVYSDLPDGVQQQDTASACAAACRQYKGAAPCIAWAYSSPTNSTPGTCWLKATPGNVPQVARSMVSAVMPGTSPYRLENKVSYHGHAIETRQQPSAAACATSCTLWQSQGIPCSAWSWLPPTDKAAQGACTMLSKMTKVDTNSKKGVAGSIGTAFYVLEQGRQYMISDVPNTTSIQPSAADCANKCHQYSGKPGCAAWTWHHPTAPSNAGSCHLKANRPETALQVNRNSQATSGSIIDNRHTLWYRAVTSITQPAPQQRVWASKDNQPRLALAIVEMRQHPLLQGVLYNAAHVYGGRQDVSLHIWHGTSNAEFVKDLVAGWKHVNLHNLGIKGLSVKEYSSLLTTKSFYNDLGDASHVLVFQTDTLLLRPVDEGFFAFDYVGAPWAHHVLDPPLPNVGNGGFSLRRVSAMKALSPGNVFVPGQMPGGQDTHPEDVYIAARLKPDKLPSVEYATMFSVETLWHPSPCGLHKAWKVHSEARLREWLRGLASSILDPAVLR